MALINKIGILQSLGERHSSFTAVSNVSYFPSLILVLVVTFMSSCNNSEPVVFPRTGMSLTELQALIGRTKPDTRPEGKPPNYTHVRVFGIIGKLGAELDSDSRIFFIGFQPDISNFANFNKMLQICEDTLGKPTSQSLGLPGDPTYAMYSWLVDNQDYYLNYFGRKFVLFYAGTPKEHDIPPSPR